ncbi:MAG: helix-turn-helix transcriptional regulator [Bacteroidales bacterium]|nr:helix-turn-helix transcriptional regulator [Bacteroidales bacterium]
MKNRIKVERAIHNMTQEELAERLSVSRQTINAIEKGRFNPSTLLALKMSSLFGVTVNDLFELEPGEAVKS